MVSREVGHTLIAYLEQASVDGIKVFVVTYLIDDVRVYWHESLSFRQACRLARALATQGKKPRVVKLRMAPKHLRRIAG